MSKQDRRLPCPGHMETLTHFIRVTIERDAMREQVRDLKASRIGWSAAHDKLLEIVSRELTGDPQMIRSLPCVKEQHDAVIRGIRNLKPPPETPPCNPA